MICRDAINRVRIGKVIDVGYESSLIFVKQVRPEKAGGLGKKDLLSYTE